MFQGEGHGGGGLCSVYYLLVDMESWTGGICPTPQRNFKLNMHS